MSAILLAVLSIAAAPSFAAPSPAAASSVGATAVPSVAMSPATSVAAPVAPAVAPAVVLAVPLADTAAHSPDLDGDDVAEDAAHTGTINWPRTLGFLALAAVLIILNGFFVAAEFALVKVRPSRIEKLRDDGKAFAGTSLWLADRLDKSLSACQLGITMASLALGWVGEPAFATLVTPVAMAAGISDPSVIHLIALAISFAVVTGLHLVVGEQFPKIFAIRRPETMLLWCALPLKFFYYILYPFLTVLDAVTAALLRLVGIDGASEHGDGPSTEEEIRHLLREAHGHGNLTRSEHRLIQAVFEFDDMRVDRIMLPRTDVAFFDTTDTPADYLELFQRTKHTRYPLCTKSLDQVHGVIHVKDLLTADFDGPSFDIAQLARPPKKVPETMPISRVLRHFQATHQLMAFVVDEHGIIMGIVTLEDVLEQIVGEVEDEFDAEEPTIVNTGPDEYLIDGSVQLTRIGRELDLSIGEAADSDTLSGLVMEHQQKIPAPGDIVELPGATAEVVETKNDRATKIAVKLSSEGSTDEAAEPEAVTKAEMASDDALLRGGN